jgi:hypothetical protein
MAASAMTATIMPPEMLANLKVSLKPPSSPKLTRVVSSLISSLHLSSLCAILMVPMRPEKYLKLALASSLRSVGSEAKAQFSRRMPVLHHLL